MGSQCPVASLPVCRDRDLVVLQTEQLGLTLGNPVACSVPGSSTVSLSLLQFMSIKSVMPSSHLTLCWCFLLLPSIFPSIRVFSNESALCSSWPKYWSFSFSISSSNECSGFISFRIDWFDLLAIQGTLQRLPQHQNVRASILWCSAFSTVHLYMTTGKTIALTIRTFVGKVMSLLFNTLSELFQTLKDDAVKVLHSICHQILETQQWPQDSKRSVFIPVPKKGNAK